jgi:RNA polymerase sigma-70 factor (ECF subfamily)
MERTNRTHRWAGRTDRELLAELARGEVGALGELFERHHDRVRALCYRLTGDPQVADDLLQESFLRILRYGSGFKGQAAFTTWLYRLVRNVCIDHMRSEDRIRAGNASWASDQALDVMPDTSDPRLDRLRTALYRLAPEKREVLVLSRYEGMSYAEIAEVCETTVGAIKVRAHRAMRELRARFEELGQTT